MKVIEFDEAISALEELFEPDKKRKIAEMEYIAALRFTKIRVDSELFKQHLDLYKYYSGRVDGITNALIRLSRLGFELSEKSNDDS